MNEPRVRMFGLINRPVKDLGICSCENLHGNQEFVKSPYSPELTAAIMGWNRICRVIDYDQLAKEMAKEAQDASHN